MILRPCPFCEKKIPIKITVCPYCHRDEKGQSVQIDPAANAASSSSDKYFEEDLADLDSTDPFVREQAVVKMAQRGFGIVQALISVLSDHAKPGLAGVAKVLGRIRDRRAIGVLTQAAKMGDEELRTAAVGALTQFHEPEILPALLAEAERPHSTIQGYLAHIVGGFQDASVVPVLARLARHASREVAFQAAYALGETGDARAIPALRKALRRRDPVVRAAAAASLRRLGASLATTRVYLTIFGWLLFGAAGIVLFLWRAHR